MVRVKDRSLPWHAGMTVADLLRAIDDTHDYAVVRVNEQYVARPHFESFVIPDGAEIYLIPMIAGG